MSKSSRRAGYNRMVRQAKDRFRRVVDQLTISFILIRAPALVYRSYSQDSPRSRICVNSKRSNAIRASATSRRGVHSHEKRLCNYIVTSASLPRRAQLYRDFIIPFFVLCLLCFFKYRGVSFKYVYITPRSALHSTQFIYFILYIYS